MLQGKSGVDRAGRGINGDGKNENKEKTSKKFLKMNSYIM